MVKKVSVFSCKSDRAVQGLTFQRDGSNLPKEMYFNGWEFGKEIEAAAYMELIGVDAREMLEDIEKYGHYIRHPNGKS